MKKHFELDYGNHRPIFLLNGEKDDFVLRASPLDKEWRTPGEIFCKLEDDGDKLIIDLEGQTLRLNYFEAEVLRLALKINDPVVKLFEITKKAIK